MLRIKKERLNKNWTQTELAFHAGMCAQDISRIENGWLKPYNGMAERLSKVLGISTKELTQEV